MFNPTDAAFRRGMHQLAARMWDVSTRYKTYDELREFIGRCEDAAKVYRNSYITPAGVDFIMAYAMTDRTDFHEINNIEPDSFGQAYLDQLDRQRENERFKEAAKRREELDQQFQRQSGCKTKSAGTEIIEALTEIRDGLTK